MPTTAARNRTVSELAVVLLNEDGSIVDAQPSCTAALGWTPEELMGRDIGLLLRTGRDVILEQLRLCLSPEGEQSGHSSFSVKALARRKNQSQFSARITVRRFPQLNCWTAAFYTHISELESDTLPAVSPEEIELATRALTEKGADPGIHSDEGGMAPAHRKSSMTAENALWRTARLLVRSRKTPEPAQETETETEMRKAEAADTVETETQEAVSNVTEVQETPAAPEKAETTVSEPEAPQQPQTTAEEVVEERLSDEVVPTAEEQHPVSTEPAAEPVKDSASDTEHRSQRQETTREVHEQTPALVRVRGELERERGQRVRAEQRVATLSSQIQALHLQLSENLAAESANSTRVSELENELEAARQLLAESQAELDKESTERRAVEEQLQITRELNAQLEATMAAFEASNDALEAEKKELAAQLEAAREALRESERNREAEMKSRQEMELQAAAAVREQQEAESRQRTAMAEAESARRASELQNQRLETDLLRLRSQAAEQERQAHRSTAALRDSLKGPVENLSQSACQLLQTGMGEEQKQMMELMLTDVLSIENALRETEGGHLETGAAPTEAAA